MDQEERIAEQAVSLAVVTRNGGNRKTIAGFVAATEEAADSRCGGKHIATHRAIARAEKFLYANLTNAVSRSELADAAGVSIRTLSRMFLARHGMGPIAFLRARRLDAAHRHLRAAEAGSIRITDVAVRYGFNHLGKFAMEYKKVFGESPSVTLKRSRLKEPLSILSRHFTFRELGPVVFKGSIEDLHFSKQGPRNFNQSDSAI